MEHNDEKRRLITQAALTRFSHFGIGKTTLQEIAEDVGLSKANVYYYFTDKDSLIASVIESILTEFKSEINKKTQELKAVSPCFIRFLEIRKSFLDKYLFLYPSNLNDLNSSPKRLMKFLEVIKNFEVNYLTNLFEQGVEKQEFVTIDIKSTSQLYLESIQGIACISHLSSIESINYKKSLIDEIYKKQIQLSYIFLSGISKKKTEINPSL